MTFYIPSGYELVQVTVVENAGDLDFTVNPQSGVNLKGLFFHLADEADLASLKILGGDGLITKTQIKANGVISLGQGNSAVNPFDGGLAFGTPGKSFITGPVHFTLDAAQDLTLDDISQVQFGATTVKNKFTDRFMTFAAPDAKNDTVQTSEDKAITIPVLLNDTDVDSLLKITSVHLESGTHGAVKITANGKSIIYTPDKDYAGTNLDPNSADATFKYIISDGTGGLDSATVNIHMVPVADKPAVTLDVLAPEATDPVNMVRFKVTATQLDLDGSEFIDRIEFATLPAGFTLITDGNLSTTGQPNSVTEYVQVLLPTGQDVSYDLTVTAYAQEKGNGNPDEASASAAQHIGINFNHNETQKNFLAEDQSIWGTGDAFSISKDFFFGVNESFDIDLLVDGHFKAGFTADLLIQGGEIDAHIPVNTIIDTTYNTTTDSLLIHTNALLEATGGASPRPVQKAILT
jgi:hypothetical protein